MKFISKLYFNVFKRVGNLRLMFVVSCIFAGISLFVVSTNTLDKVYFYRIDSNTLNPNWEIPYKITAEERENIQHLQKLLSTFDLCKYKGTKAAYEHMNYSYTPKLYIYTEPVYPNVPWNSETTLEDAEKLCSNVNNGWSIRFSVYSFSYLWNLLWVLFWFYFPFILVLPVKFIFDGYKQDKGESK